MRVKQYYYLGVLLLAALMIRLLIAPWGGHVFDLMAFHDWSLALSQVGLVNIYPASGANYPPLSMALQWLSLQLYEMLSFARGPNLADPLWIVCLKLPAILADLLIVVVAWRVAVREDVLDRPAARFILISLALNPALIFMSAHWAQYDSVYCAFLFAAFAAAQSGRNLWAGLWFGASLISKQQGVFFIAPIGLAVLALAFERHQEMAQRLRAVLLFGVGVATVVMVGFAPYALANQLPFVLERMIAIVTGQASLITWNSMNFWYFFTVGEGNLGSAHSLQDSISTVLGISFRQIGMVLLVGWMLLVAVFAWCSRQSRQTWMLAAALIGLGIFLWPTQSHERYGISAVPLAAGAALLALAGDANGKRSGIGAFFQRVDVLYAALSVGFVLNLMWAAPSDLFSWAMPIHPVVMNLLKLERTKPLPMLVSLLLIACAQWGIMLLPDPDASQMEPVLPAPDLPHATTPVL